MEFNLAGPVLAVRPYCHTDHYWQVYFDTNRAIRESFGSAGFPVPEQHLVLRNGVAAEMAPTENQAPRVALSVRLIKNKWDAASCREVGAYAYALRNSWIPDGETLFY